MKWLDLFWTMIERVMKRAFRFLFGVTPDRENGNIEEGFIRFAKFCVAGMTNTLVGYCIYCICLVILKRTDLKPLMDMSYAVAQTMSFFITGLWTYFQNNCYVFIKKGKSQEFKLITLLRTYAAYAFTGLVLNIVLLHIWISIFSINEFIAPVINIIIGVPINYIITKHWVYKLKRP